jgi:hypothetical protein
MDKLITLPVGILPVTIPMRLLEYYLASFIIIKIGRIKK